MLSWALLWWAAWRAWLPMWRWPLPTATGRVIAAWPWFALTGAYELLMGQLGVLDETCPENFFMCLYQIFTWLLPISVFTRAAAAPPVGSARQAFPAPPDASWCRLAG